MGIGCDMMGIYKRAHENQAAIQNFILHTHTVTHTRARTHTHIHKRARKEAVYVPLRLNPRGGCQTGIPVYQVLKGVS